MSIISKETWDKFTQEEKEKVRELYSSLLQALKLEEVGSQRHIVLSGMQDRDISLFGKENLQPQPLTYEDVARELFKEGVWFINVEDDKNQISLCKKIYVQELYINACLCTSREQAKKLLAINRLLNVAKFLNGKDWKPDWSDDEENKFYIGIDHYDKEILIKKSWHGQYEIVYFRTEELAKQAVDILGEDVVRLALSSDY